MPTIIAFNKTGGIKDRTKLFVFKKMRLVRIAAKRVVSDPKTMSISTAVPPPRRFEIKQPIKSPTIASGIKIGRIHKTSDTRS